MQNKFTVEFGDDKGRNFAFASLRTTVRGRFSLPEMYAAEVGQPTPGAVMAGLPVVPGAHLSVDCGKSTYRLWDPLNDKKNEDRRDRIAHVLKEAMVLPEGRKMVGFRDVEGELDADQLVTMIEELRRMQKARRIKVTSGSLPTEEAVEKHEGQELNDLWNTDANKARYKKDHRANVMRRQAVG